MAMFYQVDEKNKKIVLESGYGFKEKRNRKSEFQWGQGLIGECIKSKKFLCITEPPADYFKVSSGMGEALPTQILLFPLLFENEVIGALELCSLKALSEKQTNLINTLCNNIAINFKILNSRKKLQILFEQTNQQKENLLEQEEELRSTNEELESQAQSLKQSEEELRSINEELNQQVSTIEKQKEDLKQKTSQVEKSSQYKSEFLANMSHELRTPLNSLLILAQSFMKNKTGNLTSEQEEEAKIIYDAGTDLLTLINDVLDISKVEAGKLTIEMAAVEVSDIALSMKRQFTPLSEQQGIQFNIEHDVNLSEINTDQLRLSQILKNLLSNAIKFTHEGSVTLKISQAMESIQFSVIDTGIGIPKDKISLVFAEFQQADGSTSRKYGGTGLGLSISKKLAALMNGTLTLESEEGKGSIFTLTLPLIQNNSEKPPKAPTADKNINNDDNFKISLPKNILDIPNPINDDRENLDTTKSRILIIDDDQNFIESIIKVIRSKDFHVLAALDGRAGLMLAAAYQPNGIILDLKLPEMSGEMVLERLKQDTQTRNIPVHIISGADKSSDLIHKGALSFLQKPINHEDIASLTKQFSEDSLTHLLIVEDDHIAQKGLKDVFESLNESIKIEFADTAESAKNHLKQKSYSCVVIDLGLPDQSGITFIKSLVDEMKILTPLIVYTARDLTTEEFKEIKKYTNKIIVKGIEANERLADEVKLFIHHIEEKNNLSAHSATNENKNEHTKNIKFDGQHVLLVDDDLRNTFSLSRALEMEGLEVTIADNGQLAIEKIQSEIKFDAILMDIMMPVMDGYEAIQKIKAMSNYQDIPIIALTASATSQDKKKCIDSGANDYMTKPINVESLLALLSVWILNDR